MTDPILAKGEYEAFQRLTDSLAVAASAASQISRLRNDHRWAKVSEALNVTKEACFRLALERKQ